MHGDVAAEGDSGESGNQSDALSTELIIHLLACRTVRSPAYGNVMSNRHIVATPPWNMAHTKRLCAWACPLCSSVSLVF